MSSRSPPISDVVAVTTVRREADRVRRSGPTVETSSPRERVDRERVVGRLGTGDVHDRRAARRLTCPSTSPEARITSSPLVPFDDDVVGLAVAPPPVAPRLTSTSVTPVPVRSSTVTLSAPPRALKSTRLDVVQVHGDVADVAEEADPARRWPTMSMFSPTFGAVEQHGVDAVLALDGVAAVAGIPDEGVVAAHPEHRVVAPAAGDDIVAVAADQEVVAVAAGDGVVAGAAVDA